MIKRPGGGITLLHRRADEEAGGNVHRCSKKSDSHKPAEGGIQRRHIHQQRPKESQQHQHLGVGMPGAELNTLDFDACGFLAPHLRKQDAADALYARDDDESHSHHHSCRIAKFYSVSPF